MRANSIFVIVKYHGWQLKRSWDTESAEPFIFIALLLPVGISLSIAIHAL